MLKLGGWMIVGSTPSSGGSTKTAGAGCLIVLSSSGHVAATISGPRIDGPWDMATADNGSTAALYVTNTLFGVRAPGQAVVNQGTLLRIELSVSASAPPRVTKETVIASGLPEQASAGAFVVGPTGVAIIGSTAYVADPLANSVVRIADAATRTTSAGTGTRVTSGGLLHHPIAMVATPDGDLVVTNGLNGDIVEVTTSGRQVREFAVDPDPAQSPPGSGDLFGLAVAPSGRALYFAKDDTNTLAELS
jgi:DNA-binding beta-propeller fold protein YncE